MHSSHEMRTRKGRVLIGLAIAGTLIAACVWLAATSRGSFDTGELYVLLD